MATSISVDCVIYLRYRNIREKHVFTILQNLEIFFFRTISCLSKNICGNLAMCISYKKSRIQLLCGIFIVPFIVACKCFVLANFYFISMPCSSHLLR